MGMHVKHSMVDTDNPMVEIGQYGACHVRQKINCCTKKGHYPYPLTVARLFVGITGIN